MQSLSFTHSPPSALGSCITKPDPRGSSAGLSVAVLPTITAFLSSLSPGYVPEHIRQRKYSKPPPEPGTGENRPAHDALQKLKLACNVASHWLPSVKVVSDTVATICSSLSLAQDLGDVLDSSQRCAGVAFTLVALESLPTAAAVPTPGERGSPQQPIAIDNSETLGKIGQDNYPADAYYEQTSSFSHNSSEPIVAFRGHYDGGCHTISDINTCLFSQLDHYGVVRNLNLANATIDGDQSRLAALACEVAPFGLVQDIRAERITINNKHSGVFLTPATTGVIAGYQDKASNVSGIEIHNCSVSTSGNFSSGGVVAGQVVGLQEHINVTGSQAASRGLRSHTGIGAGELRGEIRHMLVTDSQTRTFGRSANAGTGAGKMDSDGKLSDFGAARCNAATRGDGASVGIGAGLAGGTLNRLTVVNCNCESAGQNASAGVATGSLRGQASDIVAARCKVFTNGTDANAGVGAGDNRGQITGLTSVNNTVDAIEGKTGLGAPSDYVRQVTSVNTLVGDDLINQGSPDQSQLCFSADSRFVTSDCKVLPTLLEQPPARCPSTPLNPEHGSFWPLVADANMTFSGPTVALPTSAAPLAGTLSTGAIAGIVLGAGVFVLAGVAGACIYRHYHRRPSPADAGDPQELVVTDTAGKTQEVSEQPMVADGTGKTEEEPANEHDREVTPSKPSAGDPFLEELREHVSPWHEHIYENVELCHPRSVSAVAGGMGAAK